MKSHFGLDRCADVQDIYHFIVLSNYACMNILMQSEYSNIQQYRLRSNEVPPSPFFDSFGSFLLVLLADWTTCCHAHWAPALTCSTLSHLSHYSVVVAPFQLPRVHLLLMGCFFYVFPYLSAELPFVCSSRKPIKDCSRDIHWSVWL